MLLNKPVETPGRHRHADRVLKSAAKPIFCEAFFLIRTLCCLEVPYLSYVILLKIFFCKTSTIFTIDFP